MVTALLFPAILNKAVNDQAIIYIFNLNSIFINYPALFQLKRVHFIVLLGGMYMQRDLVYYVFVELTANVICTLFV